MSDYRGDNIFEKISSFIPGYKGYSEKEGRRDTDKLLRLEIASILERSKETIEKLLLSSIEAKNSRTTMQLDKIKRNIDTTANKIKYASYGASGFFDTVQIETTDLDVFYQADLLLKQEVENFNGVLQGINLTDNVISDSNIIGILETITRRIEDREMLILEAR